MPIYKQSYRAFDGKAHIPFRWWVIVKQEMRIIFSSKMFVYLMIMGVFHLCFRVFQVTVCDMMHMAKHNPMLMHLQSMELFTINPKMFYQFLVIQAPLVLISSMMAGSGMICNDFRDNLIEVYFSKPMTRRDYVAGKIMTLLIIGMLLTAIPGIFLVILHNLLAPGIATIQATWWWPLSILAFSLCLVLPVTLGILASSALFSSQRYASIGVLMILMASTMLGEFLPGQLKDPRFALFSFPMAINRIGEYLFDFKRPKYDFPWQWGLTIVVIVVVIAYWAVSSKVKRAERAA